MLELWNDALRSIEGKLDGEVDVAELARSALTSEYHFRRVFSALAGIPLSEYIRRRKLTMAAAEILEDGSNVLQIALRYGYTADAFTRAFKAMHGITPSEARKPGALLRSQPRVTFRLTVRGSSTMRHRISEQSPFRIVGRRARLPLKYDGENPAIKEFHASLPAGFTDRLRELADAGPFPKTLFVSDNFTEGRADGSEFDYYHAVATTKPADALPEDLDVLQVPASTWVTFEAESRDGDLAGALQSLWAESFSEWFPSNPYRIVAGPEILQVFAESTDWSSGKGELWIPIERA